MDRKRPAGALAAAKSSPRRPILTLANGDNTWIISIPRPAGSTGKIFYHILQDPWLSGPSDSFFRWVLRMQHREKGAFGSIQAIEDWIQETEEAVGGTKGEAERWLDAVLVSHTNPDHMHEATLRAFDPSMKVFAVKDAATVISAMKYFEDVTIVPDFVRGKEWPRTPAMPDWLSVFRLPDESGQYPYLFHAIIFGISDIGARDEMILYTPHGVEPGIVEDARKANPEAKVLAMMHPLNECGVGVKSKGVANGLKLERKNEPKYWINTHDDKLVYSGVLSWFMQYGHTTLEQGLEKEAEERGGQQRKPNYVVVGNGSSYVLA